MCRKVQKKFVDLLGDVHHTISALGQPIAEKTERGEDTWPQPGLLRGDKKEEAEKARTGSEGSDYRNQASQNEYYDDD